MFYSTAYGCNEKLIKDFSLSSQRYFEVEINFCNSTLCPRALVREIKPVSLLQCLSCSNHGVQT
jgi:hypothetical protein